MQINRLFEIVYLLLDRKRMTAHELAGHFEVSKRTILRDIEALAAAGIPVYTSRGKGGGISILDNFVLNKTTISDEEQDQILFALQSLSSTRQMDTAALLSKLSTLFAKTDTNWIEVDFSRWGHTEPDKEKFEILKRAIIKKEAVAFSYASSFGETTDRTVYPLKLVFKSKAWYLQAYCLLKDGYRTFKVNRILSAKALPESFAEQDFSPPPLEALDAAFPCLVDLELRFAPSAAYRLYDEFDAQGITKNDDGSFTVKTGFPDDPWLYGFLLSFGTAVQVVRPQNVRDALRAQAEEIRERYLSDKT